MSTIFLSEEGVAWHFVAQSPPSRWGHENILGKGLQPFWFSDPGRDIQNMWLFGPGPRAACFLRPSWNTLLLRVGIKYIRCIRFVR